MKRGDAMKKAAPVSSRKAKSQIDAYIAEFPKDVQAKLQQVRQVARDRRLRTDH
jgi:hypothetical protein